MSGMVPGIQMLLYMDNGKTMCVERFSVVSDILREGCAAAPREQVTGAVVEMAGQQVLLARAVSCDGLIMTLRVARVVVAGVGIESVGSPGGSVQRETVSCGRHRAVRALERWERRQ
jgi:hypothetical protein